MTVAARCARTLVATLLVAAPAPAAPPLPFRTAVLLEWGEGAGSDAFRDDLGRALTGALTPGCFTAVELVGDDPAAVHADLLLTVLLSDAEEELRVEDSIAGALQPGEPGKELRRIARFEVTVQATLATFDGRRPVSGKHLVANVSRRPLVLGEDPQVTARADAIDQIVSALTKAFCRGGAKQESKIREALAAAAHAPTDEATAPR
jgi:hypothetical protein